MLMGYTLDQNCRYLCGLQHAKNIKILFDIDLHAEQLKVMASINFVFFIQEMHILVLCILNMIISAWPVLVDFSVFKTLFKYHVSDYLNI
jgi:hypothetical protein